MRMREKITKENLIRIIRNLSGINRQKNKLIPEKQLQQMVAGDTAEVKVHLIVIMEMKMMQRKLFQKEKTEKDRLKSRSKRNRRKDNRVKYLDYHPMSQNRRSRRKKDTQILNYKISKNRKTLKTRNPKEVGNKKLLVKIILQRNLNRDAEEEESNRRTLWNNKIR